MPAMLDPTTIPLRTLTMTAFELLNAIMLLDSLYWQKDDMPTVKSLCATSQLTARYLAQRATTHDHYRATYGPPVNWTGTLLAETLAIVPLSWESSLIRYLMGGKQRNTNALLKRTLVGSARCLTPSSTYSFVVKTFKRPRRRSRKRRSSRTFLLVISSVHPRRPCLRRFGATFSSYCSISLLPSLIYPLR
jgi:hypothetical protein